MSELEDAVIGWATVKLRSIEWQCNGRLPPDRGEELYKANLAATTRLLVLGNQLILRKAAQ